MLKHEDDLTEEEKQIFDKFKDNFYGDNEELPDEFNEEEGCIPPKEN